MELKHSCQRMCKYLYNNEPENFIGKYNAHYKLCDEAITDNLLVDFYFNGQLRIIGSLNEHGQVIDSLKKYYNTGALAELLVYNSIGQPQLLMSYYENRILKTKIDFVEGTKFDNDSFGKQISSYKFKPPTYVPFGEGIDTLRTYYDNGSIKELLAYDDQNKAQFILAYYESGVLRTRLDFKKKKGLSFHPSGKVKARSTFNLNQNYNSKNPSLKIKEYYTNGQLKSYGEYLRKELKDFYIKGEHQIFGIENSMHFQSYYEDGQLKSLLTKGKYPAIKIQSYYKGGQLKSSFIKDESGEMNAQSYYENGQIKSLALEYEGTKKSKEFHKNGQIRSLTLENNAVMKSKEFDENGQLITKNILRSKRPSIHLNKQDTGVEFSNKIGELIRELLNNL